MWKIEDFKQAVDIAMDKNGAKIVAKFPAKMVLIFVIETYHHST